MGSIKAIAVIFLVAAVLGASQGSVLFNVYENVRVPLANLYSFVVYKFVGSALTSIPPLTTVPLGNTVRNFTTYVKVEEGLVSVIYSNDLTARVYSNLGGLECEGGVALRIASTAVSQISTNATDNNSNFRGDYACSQSCNGECIPPTATGTDDAPASLYPFQCKCAADGCDANGPTKPGPWWIPGTKVVCQRDALCKCGNIDSDPNNGYTGYLCSWWNVANNQTIVLQLDSTFSLIRWCDCCPNQ